MDCCTLSIGCRNCSVELDRRLLFLLCTSALRFMAFFSCYVRGEPVATSRLSFDAADVPREPFSRGRLRESESRASLRHQVRAWFVPVEYSGRALGRPAAATSH
jgi:hypothetical protein